MSGIESKMEEIVIQYKVEDLEQLTLIDNTKLVNLNKYSCNELQNKLLTLTNKNKMYNLPRKQLETDPSYRHLVCYFLIIDSDTKEIIVYKREKPTEKRLLQKYSIGWGGHIGLEDASCLFTKLTNLKNIVNRELSEELSITNTLAKITDDVFLLQNNIDDVGRVHLGIIYLIFQKDIKTNIKSNEQENKIEFYDTILNIRKKLETNEIQLETWSSSIVHNTEVLNLIDTYKI